MNRRVWGGVLLALYVGSVAVVALAPYSWSLNRLTVRLFEFFRTDLPIAPNWMMPEDYGNLLNVAMFVPLGLLLAWWLGSQWGWALPVALALSVLIEMVQRIPEVARESSLDDVACNAMGACVGVVLVAAVRAAAPPVRPLDPAADPQDRG